MNYAKIIKGQVSSPELFSFYGFERNRAGFICCPFHGEKTPSMKVYDGDRGYCCFGGCGARGDIIDFVQRLFGLSFVDAQAKINEDFNLGLPIGAGADPDRRRQLRLEADKRRKQQQTAKETRERLNAAYDRALDAWIRLDRQRRQNVPKTPIEPISDEYAEAVKKIDYAAYMVDVAEGRRYAYEHDRERYRGQ